MKKTKLIGLIISLLPLISIFIVPGSEALSSAGVAAICVLATTLLLLLTEALPMMISCFFGLTLMIVFKAVPTPNAAFTGFGNSAVWFVLISFGISYAISSTNIPKRLLVSIMGLFGKKINSIIFAIMLCNVVLAIFVSNVAATILFMTVCFSFLNVYDNEEDKRRTGRTLMITLPIASILGGMLTPAGSSLNLLCLGFLEDLTGLRVTFLQWMIIAVPIVIVLIPVVWKIIVTVNKPAEISPEKLDEFVNSIRVTGKLTFQEKYIMVVLIGMITCWILGSWFPVFNITVVAAVGLTLMFLPDIFGVQIISPEGLVKEISWPAIMLVGSIISVGNILVESGATTWFVATLMPASLSLPPFAIVSIVALIVFVMLIIIPVAPALISVLAAPLVGLAAAVGVSPVLLIMTMAMTVCNCYMLPLDTVPLITYVKGYYKKSELAKTAVWIQLIIVVLVTIWLPVIIKLLKL